MTLFRSAIFLVRLCFSRTAICGALSAPEAIAGERDKEGERRHEDIIDPAQPGRQPDRAEQDNQQRRGAADHSNERAGDAGLQKRCVLHAAVLIPPGGPDSRSEEHTSELQSLMRISYAVFCLKKKRHTHQTTS